MNKKSIIKHCLSLLAVSTVLINTTGCSITNKTEVKAAEEKLTTTNNLDINNIKVESNASKIDNIDKISESSQYEKQRELINNFCGLDLNMVLQTASNDSINAMESSSENYRIVSSEESEYTSYLHSLNIETHDLRKLFNVTLIQYGNYKDYFKDTDTLYKNVSNNIKIVTKQSKSTKKKLKDSKDKINNKQPLNFIKQENLDYNISKYKNAEKHIITYIIKNPNKSVTLIKFTLYPDNYTLSNLNIPNEDLLECNYDDAIKEYIPNEEMTWTATGLIDAMGNQLTDINHTMQNNDILITNNDYTQVVIIESSLIENDNREKYAKSYMDEHDTGASVTKTFKIGNKSIKAKLEFNKHYDKNEESSDNFYDKYEITKGMLHITFISDCSIDESKIIHDSIILKQKG